MFFKCKKYMDTTRLSVLIRMTYINNNNNQVDRKKEEQSKDM